MASFNKVTLVGNIGKDAELKYLPTGTPIVEFSLAVQDGWGEKKTTNWFDIKQFGDRAEKVCEYLRKGGTVLVEGKLSPRSWEKDGQKHYRIDIVANDIVLLGGGGRESGSGTVASSRVQQSPRPAPARRAPAPSYDDDLPFE